MVTFDEMRRDQVALKQQVEKLEKTCNNQVVHQCGEESHFIEKVNGYCGKQIVSPSNLHGSRLDVIEEVFARTLITYVDFVGLVTKSLEIETDENGLPTSESIRLNNIEKSIEKLNASDNNPNASYAFQREIDLWKRLDLVESSLGMGIDPDTNNPVKVSPKIIQMVADIEKNNVSLKELAAAGKRVAKNEAWLADVASRVVGASTAITTIKNTCDKLDQNNVDLLKKFNTFKTEVNRKVGDNKIDVDNLAILITNLEKRVDEYDNEITLKFLEKRINEYQAETKKVLVEKDTRIQDLEKRLNNLTDRLIKLEGTAVRSPVIKQPQVKEAEDKWLNATECTSAIKTKFPELKDLKVEEFSNSMAWSRYVSEREGNSHNRKVMPIGVKLNAVRNDRKGNVEYNPAFIEKFADRVLKHRKASSEFQCKGVEE